MNSFDDILKQVQKKISCPLCKNNFDIKNIKLRGFFDNVYLFQTICNNKHKTVTTLFALAYNKKNNPIDENDLHNLVVNLKEFNGDFSKIE